MKQLLYSIFSIVLFASLSACSSSHPAVGQWMPDNDTKGNNYVAINSDGTVEMIIDEKDGNAKISGTWSEVPEKENTIRIKFDPNTIDLDFNNELVELIMTEVIKEQIQMPGEFVLIDNGNRLENTFNRSKAFVRKSSGNSLLSSCTSNNKKVSEERVYNTDAVEEAEAVEVAEAIEGTETAYVEESEDSLPLENRNYEYTGKIGKSPIEVQLVIDGENVTGKYAYLSTLKKYGKGPGSYFYLSGNIDASGNINLVSKMHKSNDIFEYITLPSTVLNAGADVTGELKNANTGDTYPVELQMK